MTARKLVACATLLMFGWTTLAAEAADVAVTCEKRPFRSRASVDGSALKSGMYRAVLKSGTHVARSPFEQSVRGEAQFDFDSNPGETGATPIGAQFIVDGKVRGYLVDQTFQRVTPIVEVKCRIRR